MLCQEGHDETVATNGSSRGGFAQLWGTGRRRTERRLAPRLGKAPRNNWLQLNGLAWKQ